MSQNRGTSLYIFSIIHLENYNFGMYSILEWITVCLWINLSIGEKKQFPLVHIIANILASSIDGPGVNWRRVIPVYTWAWVTRGFTTCTVCEFVINSTRERL